MHFNLQPGYCDIKARYNFHKCLSHDENYIFAAIAYVNELLFCVITLISLFMEISSVIFKIYLIFFQNWGKTLSLVAPGLLHYICQKSKVRLTELKEPRHG